MIWMISANGKMYDHASSFATNGFIDWRQRAKYSVGDIVYIYCTRPFKRVMYKCEVVKHSMPFSECIDDAKFWINVDEYEKSKEGLYARLKLLEQVDNDNLCLEALCLNGLSAAPQGPIRVSSDLHLYINRYFNDYYTDGFFVDVSEQEDYHEGHVRNVKVNIYERSSIARRKCIEHHGTNCIVCGIDFAKRYGPLGEGFIHVHHLRPLYTIGTDYVINYKTDLIPVCPNCHAMIHRIPNIESMTIDDIKNLLNQNQPNTLPPPATPPEKQDIKTQPGTKSIASHTGKQFNISKIRAGMVVFHKVYGEGVIINLNAEQKHICIKFPVGDKTFVVPDAFDKGFLKIE